MFRDLWVRLHEILESDRHFYLVYIYRVTPDGKVIKSYLKKCIAFPALLEILSDHHGGGAFKLMLMKGRPLV